MAWTAPRTWVAGETVTASIGNTHWRDNFKAIGDAWTAYTPTWTASTNPAIGNGTLLGASMQAGKYVSFWITITMGSTTTYGSGGWNLSLPVATHASLTRVPFLGNARDASASVDYPISCMGTGTTVNVKTLPTTAGNAYVFATSAAPFTWTTSDILAVAGTYEAA